MVSLAGCRCLVTGATGFIGWHLVKRLVRESAEVSCVVEPGKGLEDLEALDGIAELHTADLRDLQRVQKFVEAAKPSFVFHLAAAGVTDPTVDPLMAIRVNIEGTVNLLLALNGSCDLFINTGTCHEYGTHSGPLPEDAVLAPTSVYAGSKVAAWHFWEVFVKTRGWQIATLRLFSVYGPRQPATTLVPSLILSGLRGTELPMTGGSQIRDFIFIDDVIAGYLLTAESHAAAGRTFNLCSGHGVSLRELVALLEKLNVPPQVRFGALPYRAAEVPHLVGDGSLAREVLGWEPRVGLEEGLRGTIEWYKRMVADNPQRHDSLR